LNLTFFNSVILERSEESLDCWRNNTVEPFLARTPHAEKGLNSLAVSKVQGFFTALKDDKV
jgi:hypothetical protein